MLINLSRCHRMCAEKRAPTSSRIGLVEMLPDGRGEEGPYQFADKSVEMVPKFRGEVVVLRDDESTGPPMPEL